MPSQLRRQYFALFTTTKIIIENVCRNCNEVIKCVKLAGVYSKRYIVEKIYVRSIWRSEDVAQRYEILQNNYIYCVWNVCDHSRLL